MAEQDIELKASLICTGIKKSLRELAASAFYYSGALGWRQRNAQPSWRVLMYHRVVAPENSPYPLQPGMYVRPETFRRHMQYLAKNCNVIALEELAEKLKQGAALPERTISITFDDGWLDNYLNAFPVLTEHSLPATVFLATSFVGTSHLMWPDKLCLAASALSKTPQHIASVMQRISAAKEFDAPTRDCLEHMLKTEGTDSASFLLYLDRLIELVKRLEHKQRTALVQSVFTLAQEFTELRVARAFANWTEIEEMARAGIRFGSHTHLHQEMTSLTEAQINDEVQNSLMLIRTHGMDPSPVFCYPEGRSSPLTQQTLAKNDIKFALTTSPRRDLNAPPLLIERTAVHEDISRSIELFTFRVWGM